MNFFRKNLLEIILLILVIILLAISSAFYKKSVLAYDQGRRDQYMEIQGKITEAYEVLESISLPPKGDVYLESESNSKGEQHSEVVLSESITEWVYNNCTQDTIKIYPQIVEYAVSKKVKPEVVFAIAWADSQCGQQLATPNNYGNVNNNDRGTRVGFFTPFDGWKAIVDTLNNQYLGKNTMLGQLSNGGRVDIGAKYDCRNAIEGYKCYATSEFNWGKNTIRALKAMGIETDAKYLIRL